METLIRQFDIVIATDLRFPGGNSSSTAEEIRAQSAAGYRTGLLHVPSPIVKVSRAFNRRLVDLVHEGQAELLMSGMAVQTKLLVVRHPTVLANLRPSEYPIEAQHRVIAVNQIGQIGDRILYDPEALAPEFEASYGPTTWAPISPVIRESLMPYHRSIDIATDDWFNIIDVDEWYLARDGVRGVPVIGRHGRDHELKWPTSAEDLRAAYPAGDEFRIRILGGADTPTQVLGELPGNWEVLPYDLDGPKEFLRTIDFFVYFHHPELREAFGRTIFEALASGAIAVVPPDYEPLFGSACLYAKPEDVRELVRTYSADRVKYGEQSRRGADFARAKFGHRIHRARVEALIGPPAEIPTAVAASSAARSSRKTLLFMSSNGAGVGHVTRLMAMASRASSEFQPVVFTLSQGIRWVEQAGFPVEYLPSQRYLARDRPNAFWNKMLQHRLEQLIEIYSPAGIIFDGTQPYRGLLDTFIAHPEITAVWSRRGMWRPHITKNLRGLSEHFDMVIEAGEIAGAYDQGVTRKFQKFATVVDPITFLDRDDLLTRDDARAALGLDLHRPAVLVQLGAGNINDTTGILNAAVMTLAEDESYQIRIARSAIAGRLDDVPGVSWVDAYPLSKYFNAFDFVVGAAGYNTFHELVGFGIPSVLVPNAATEVDDQAARARFAKAKRAALVAEEDRPDQMRAAVRDLMRPEVRERMRRALEKLQPRLNGADAAMRAFEQAVDDNLRRAAR